MTKDLTIVNCVWRYYDLSIFQYQTLIGRGEEEEWHAPLYAFTAPQSHSTTRPPAAAAAAATSPPETCADNDNIFRLSDRDVAFQLFQFVCVLTLVLPLHILYLNRPLLHHRHTTLHSNRLNLCSKLTSHIRKTFWDPAMMISILKSAVPSIKSPIAGYICSRHQFDATCCVLKSLISLVRSINNRPDTQIQNPNSKRMTHWRRKKKSA